MARCVSGQLSLGSLYFAFSEIITQMEVNI